jgi:hypothetical protein
MAIYYVLSVHMVNIVMCDLVPVLTTESKTWFSMMPTWMYVFDGKAARLLSLREDRNHTMEVELPRVQEKGREKTSYEKRRKRKRKRKRCGLCPAHRDRTKTP